MIDPKLYILSAILLIGFIIPGTNMGEQILVKNDSPKDISCREALKNVNKIKVGMNETEIINLIGTPTTRMAEKWSYSFFECAPPPQAGTQSIIGVSIIFKEKILTELNWAWIDATGPGSVTPPKKKKKPDVD